MSTVATPIKPAQEEYLDCKACEVIAPPKHLSIFQQATAAVSNIVAKTKENEFLNRESWRSIGKDLGHISRRHPVPTLLASMGLGYLIARATGHRRS